MSKYYCLIAGLPDITLDDSRLTYSVADFRNELSDIVTRKDQKLIDLIRTWIRGEVLHTMNHMPYIRP